MKGHVRGVSRAQRAAPQPGGGAPREGAIRVPFLQGPRVPRPSPAASAPDPLSAVAARRRRAEQIMAGLPADVMDSLVDDMAEAVVAMLLSQAVIEANEGDDAGSDL